MFGPIAGAESMVIFGERRRSRLRDGGSATRHRADVGRSQYRQPMAMIMAAAGLLSFMKEDLAKRVSQLPSTRRHWKRSTTAFAHRIGWLSANNGVH